MTISDGYLTKWNSTTEDVLFGIDPITKHLPLSLDMIQSSQPVLAHIVPYYHDPWWSQSKYHVKLVEKVSNRGMESARDGGKGTSTAGVAPDEDHGLTHGGRAHAGLVHNAQQERA